MVYGRISCRTPGFTPGATFPNPLATSSFTFCPVFLFPPQFHLWGPITAPNHLLSGKVVWVCHRATRRHQNPTLHGLSHSYSVTSHQHTLQEGMGTVLDHDTHLFSDTAQAKRPAAKSVLDTMTRYTMLFRVPSRTHTGGPNPGHALEWGGVWRQGSLGGNQGRKRSFR